MKNMVVGIENVRCKPSSKVQFTGSQLQVVHLDKSSCGNVATASNKNCSSDPGVNSLAVSVNVSLKVVLKRGMLGVASKPPVSIKNVMFFFMSVSSSVCR